MNEGGTVRAGGASGNIAAGGFTLLEVLVALAITAIAIAVVAQLFSSNLRALFASGGAVSAAVRADARLREIMADSSLSEKSGTETTEQGDRMDVSVTEVLKERTNALPVQLWEISLTIHWLEGRKEKKFTLRTMKMVDRSGP